MRSWSPVIADITNTFFRFGRFSPLEMLIPLKMSGASLKSSLKAASSGLKVAISNPRWSTGAARCSKPRSCRCSCCVDCLCCSTVGPICFSPFEGRLFDTQTFVDRTTGTSLSKGFSSERDVAYLINTRHLDPLLRTARSANSRLFCVRGQECC